MEMKRVVFYTNQFFGQIGGEEMAYVKPRISDGAIGSANAFAPKLKDAQIVNTILCGDNYYAENMEQARKEIVGMIRAIKPDLVIAGPAFNAGRFGIACADICAFVKETLQIEAITGLYGENPAVEMYRKKIYILEVGKSAAAMRKAADRMANFANKLLEGKEIGFPEEEGYFAKGQRVNLFREKDGAERALDMLVKKLRGEPFQTELEISSYERIQGAPPVADLSQAKVALLTTGGIVPMGNPDHLPAATAKFYKKYDIASMQRLNGGEFESVHAGFDPVYANEDPNRIVPLDTLRQMEQEGKIGSIYPFLISTTGNSTAVSDAMRMGQEIAQELLDAQVSAAILTST